MDNPRGCGELSGGDNLVKNGCRTPLASVRGVSRLQVQIATACARLDHFFIHNRMQYNLYLPHLPLVMRPDFPFLCKSDMHTRWMAGIAAHKSGLLLHPQRIQCKLYAIYQMQCILYPPDSEKNVSTPVEVWREDRMHPITQRGQLQQAMVLGDCTLIGTPIL